MLNPLFETNYAIIDALTKNIARGKRSKTAKKIKAIKSIKWFSLQTCLESVSNQDCPPKLYATNLPILDIVTYNFMILPYIAICFAYVYILR